MRAHGKCLLVSDPHARLRSPVPHQVPESDVLAQEASMFVLQREGTNAERASSAAVGAFLLGMAPSGAAMQGVDAGGVAAGDARASGSAGVNVSYVT